MTAKEATEHGRARARARADSLTKLDLEKDAASVLETTTPPTRPFSADKETSKIIGETKMAAKAKADSGVASAGLITTVQPAAKAGATFLVIMAFGKFQGVIAATTPTACLLTKLTALS